MMGALKGGAGGPLPRFQPQGSEAGPVWFFILSVFC